METSNSDALLRAVVIATSILITMLAVIIPRLVALRTDSREDAQNSIENSGNRCAFCGRPNPPDHRFCGYCGGKLGTDPPAKEA